MGNKANSIHLHLLSQHFSDEINEFKRQTDQGVKPTNGASLIERYFDVSNHAHVTFLLFSSEAGAEFMPKALVMAFSYFFTAQLEALVNILEWGMNATTHAQIKPQLQEKVEWLHKSIGNSIDKLYVKDHECRRKLDATFKAAGYFREVFSPEKIVRRKNPTYVVPKNVLCKIGCAGINNRCFVEHTTGVDALAVKQKMLPGTLT